MWNDNFEVIDFHSHILPSVDDGARDMETAVKMLEMLSAQGVDKVVSTSHYYNFSEDIQSFLTCREESLYKLETYIKEQDLFVPDIVPAAEVRMYPGLWREPNLDKLCIGETKNILIEMPYDKWTEWMYSEIYALIAKGYTPVMAHLERYIDRIPSKEIFSKLLHMDVLIQVNAESFEERGRRKFIKKLVKGGFLIVLGTDCHNMSSRRPKIDGALKYISKKYTDEYLEKMMKLAVSLTQQS